MMSTAEVKSPGTRWLSATSCRVRRISDVPNRVLYQRVEEEQQASPEVDRQLSFEGLSARDEEMAGPASEASGGTQDELVEMEVEGLQGGTAEWFSVDTPGSKRAESTASEG